VRRIFFVLSLLENEKFEVFPSVEAARDRFTKPLEA